MRQGLIAGHRNERRIGISLTGCIITFDTFTVYSTLPCTVASVPVVGSPNLTKGVEPAARALPFACARPRCAASDFPLPICWQRHKSVRQATTPRLVALTQPRNRPARSAVSLLHDRGRHGSGRLRREPSHAERRSEKEATRSSSRAHVAARDVPPSRRPRGRRRLAAHSHPLRDRGLRRVPNLGPRERRFPSRSGALGA
jgi:hypothetical protein